METKLQKGVYCFSQSGVLYKANEWDKNQMPQGVVVVPDEGSEYAFIVAPHNTIAAQLSPRKEVYGLITDRESWDALAATKRIAEAYAGMHHDDPDNETEYEFDGSPAADFCLGYSHGKIGAGEWAVPTEKQLKAIAKHIREINECFRAMSCPTMPLGWYWSSIACEDCAWCAWLVNVYFGGTLSLYRGDDYYVRAVSAFRQLA